MAQSRYPKIGQRIAIDFNFDDPFESRGLAKNSWA